MRIGFGYDVHQLVEGRKLIIGGVDIPFEKGLLGHSDADVLIHAVMDSILGALALGDIGKHFPDTDDKYKDISSVYLLSQVAKLMNENGYEIGNIDAVVVAQRPKLASYIDDMRKIIAETLSTSVGNISIKATTTEYLGFEGREEGISAYSVCLLKKVIDKND
ncbi:MAG TPA: 2-C-methyl-D-erythritol 2,4-cyclodiphosphate synthase [Tissierellaceae bacterium]